VGIESLLFHKSDENELIQVLDDLENIDIDTDIVNRFLRYLYNEYLVHKNGTEYQQICQRMEV